MAHNIITSPRSSVAAALARLAQALGGCSSAGFAGATIELQDGEGIRWGETGGAPTLLDLSHHPRRANA